MKMKMLVLTIAAVSALLLSQATWSASTKEEIVALKEQVAEMQKDVAEIKKLLEQGARAPAAAPAAQPPFKEQTVGIGDSPVKGDPKAPVTLIEYSDYQCPFCARHYRDVLPTLTSEYIDTGKLKFVMRENPIESIHRNAAGASMAGLCAKDQGKYWEMHDKMFDNQNSLDVDSLKKYAAELELDTAAFDECLDSKKYFKQVNADIASGAALGVRGTPGFFLGLTDPEDSSKVNLSVYIKGAQSLDNFRAAIDDLLKSAE